VGVRVRFGRLWVDALTFDGALAAVRALVERGTGGAVFTPNVDHIVMAETDASLRRAYRHASLAFADGVPLIWASRTLLRAPLPAKLSGSDMILPLARLAAERGWGVYLLGGLPGAAAEAGRRLTAQCGVRIVGVDDSRVTVAGGTESDRLVLERVRAARPDLVFVALGAPKQELWISRALDEIRPAVAIGVGASLDFIAGRLKRSPAWMSRVGLEWTYRLAQEPRRLWYRYLVRGPRFVGIVWRTARLRSAQRVRAAVP
jgi:N-acetylglucosaminyldiphosphoundecaprenol N-acetyl-beta-D-mannosaminyltransferase